CHRRTSAGPIENYLHHRKDITFCGQTPTRRAPQHTEKTTFVARLAAPISHWATTPRPIRSLVGDYCCSMPLLQLGALCLLLLGQYLFSFDTIKHNYGIAMRGIEIIHRWPNGRALAT